MKLIPGAPTSLLTGVACAALLSLNASLVRSEDVPSVACLAANRPPDNVIALAEIPRLAHSVIPYHGSPVPRQRLLGMPAYAAMMKSEPFKRFQMGIAAFEGEHEAALAGGRADAHRWWPHVRTVA